MRGRGPVAVVSWGLALASSAGCGGGEHAVVVRFDREGLEARAAGVEVSLVEACGDLGETGAEPGAARLSARFRTTDPAPRLGRIGTGRYGLYARVRDEACAVFAAGCDEVEVSRGDEDLVVHVGELEGPGCLAGERCEGGLCEASGPGDGDADLDADEPPDGDVEPDGDEGCGPTEGWTRSVEGSAHLPLVAIAPDGTIVLLGHFTGTADLDPGPGVDDHRAAYNRAAFVLTLDQAGERLWVRTIDGFDGFTATSLDVLANGTVVVAGYFDSVVDLDPGPGLDERRSRGGEDGFVLALDPDGERLWAGVVGGAGDDRALDLSSAGSSRVALGGSFAGTADLDPGSARDDRAAVDGTDGFLVLLDAGGAPLWARTFGGAGDQAVVAVTLSVDPRGDRLRGVVAAGPFDGAVDLDPGPEILERASLGAPDLFVARLDDLGSLVWGGAAGGDGVDDTVEVTDLAVAPGDDLVVYGELAGVVDLDLGEDVDEVPSASALSDAFALRLNAAGLRQWAVTFRGEGHELSTMAAAAPDSAVLLGGRFLEPVDVDPTADEVWLSPEGGVDGYLVRLDPFGDLVWGRAIGGGLEDFVGGVAVSPEGWIAVAGVMTAAVDFDPEEGCGDVRAPALSSAVFVSRLLGGGTYRY